MYVTTPLQVVQYSYKSRCGLETISAARHIARGTLLLLVQIRKLDYPSLANVSRTIMRKTGTFVFHFISIYALFSYPYCKSKRFVHYKTKQKLTAHTTTIKRKLTACTTTMKRKRNVNYLLSGTIGENMG